jgi:hypothetical protein
MSKGFFTMAQNSGSINYVKMAYALALSLKATQNQYNKLSIGVTLGQTMPGKYKEIFDQVIEIPDMDNAEDSSWKLENEYKAFEMTPYSETIKLDADMLFFGDISEWWSILERKEMLICDKVLTYRQNVVTSDFYRKTFTNNCLPNTYSAFFYFKKSNVSKELFNMLEIITLNWQYYWNEYLGFSRPKEFSTDVALGLAVKFLDLKTDCMTNDIVPSFTHMKSRLQGWNDNEITEDWTKHVAVNFTPDLQCKIGNFRQVYPLHYHVKSFLSDDIIRKYEKALGI